MPRSILSDQLKVHEFHLLDIDFSFATPPFVLFPVAGFQSITMPEITTESEDIREGTSDFIHHALGKSSTNTITLTKGVTPFNSDFWRWMVACLTGSPGDPNYSLMTFLADLAKMVALQGSPTVPGKRRNMLLLHATGISPEGLLEAMASGSGLDLAKGAALLPAAGVLELQQQITSWSQGLVDVGITSIPGKVYLLRDCLPTRYKPGSDFDAMSTAISIEELDLVYFLMEEFSISG